MWHPIDQIDDLRAKQLQKEHDGQMSSGRSRGDERLALPGRAAGDAGGGRWRHRQRLVGGDAGVNRVPYAVAKGGVDAITACLAFEYAEHGIRVCGVAPGATEAPPRRKPRNADPPSEQEELWYQQIVDQALLFSLMKRFGTTEEQAAAILFLAPDEASYITGVTLPAAGGNPG
jgi:NAD(P)-dependent dehydrogenase (short-subunit alcohol dehydrogenase family)